LFEETLMQRPVQINFHGLEHSDAVAQRIRDKAGDLEKLFDRIISCRVTVETPPQHHRHGGTFAVHIDLRVPDDEIVVSREPGRDHAHEDVYVAIRDAFEAAARQLESYARRRRGEVKHRDPSA
jgi:ribosome-associated translation inhibitor RaiA